MMKQVTAQNMTVEYTYRQSVVLVFDMKCCSFVNCSNNSKKNGNDIRFFHFPVDSTLRDRWRIASGKPNDWRHTSTYIWSYSSKFDRYFYCKFNPCIKKCYLLQINRTVKGRHQERQKDFLRGDQKWGIRPFFRPTHLLFQKTFRFYVTFKIAQGELPPEMPREGHCPSGPLPIFSPLGVNLYLHFLLGIDKVALQQRECK